MVLTMWSVWGGTGPSPSFPAPEPRKTLRGVVSNLPGTEEGWSSQILPITPEPQLGSQERGKQEAKWNMGQELMVGRHPPRRPGIARACRLRGRREAGSPSRTAFGAHSGAALPQRIKYESWLLVSRNLTVVKFQQTGGDFQFCENYSIQDQHMTTFQLRSFVLPEILFP